MLLLPESGAREHLDRQAPRLGRPTLGTAGSGDALYGTQTFHYDALGRLASSSGLSGSGTPASYQYDLDGNRTQRVQGSVTTAYAYDRTGELVSQSDGTLTAFAYDGYGDMTAKAESGSTVTALAWDVAGRLVSAGSGGTTATFAPDALGRPWQRSVTGAGTDTYAYVGTSSTAWEVSNSGGSGVTTDSAVDAAGRYGLRAGASAAAWCLFDLHGSAAGLESGARSVTDAWRYDGWGQTVASTGSSTDPWRYRGALDLSPTASPLYAMGARY